MLFPSVGSLFTRRLAAHETEKAVFNLQEQYFPLRFGVFTVTLELICNPQNNVRKAIGLLVQFFEFLPKLSIVVF